MNIASQHACLPSRLARVAILMAILLGALAFCAASSANAAVDLEITQSESADPIFASDYETYTLHVQNKGTSTATNVTVIDDLPTNAQVTLQAFSTPVGICGFHPLTWSGTCQISSLTSGAGAFIDVTVRAVTPDQPITNKARISSDQTDSNPADNATSETTTVQGQAHADLAVSVVQDKTFLKPDDIVTLTVTVTNTGPQHSLSTSLVQDFDASHLRWDSGSAGCTDSIGQVRCQLDDIESGATVTRTIRLRATGGAAPLPIDTSVASATTPDPDQSNNTHTTTLAMASFGAADLAITGTGPATPVSPGGLTNLTFRVANEGPYQSKGVAVSIPLGTELAFVSGSASSGNGCQEAAGVVTCGLGDLSMEDPAEVVILGVRLAPDAKTDATVTAEVSSTSTDPRADNNTAAVDVLLGAATTGSGGTSTGTGSTTTGTGGTTTGGTTTGGTTTTTTGTGSTTTGTDGTTTGGTTTGGATTGTGGTTTGGTTTTTTGGGVTSGSLGGADAGAGDGSGLSTGLVITKETLREVFVTSPPAPVAGSGAVIRACQSGTAKLVLSTRKKFRRTTAVAAMPSLVRADGSSAVKLNLVAVGANATKLKRAKRRLKRAVAKAVFRIDGKRLARDKTAPFSVALKKQLTAAKHELTVVARLKKTPRLRASRVRFNLSFYAVNCQ